MAFQVEKLLVHAARNAANQQLRIEAEYACKFGHTVDRRCKLLRISPHAVDRGTDRKRLAVSIGNRAAVCGDLLGSKVTRVGLLVQGLLS